MSYLTPERQARHQVIAEFPCLHDLPPTPLERAVAEAIRATLRRLPLGAWLRDYQERTT